MAKHKFQPVDARQSFPKLEEGVLKFWDKEKIFEKSLAKNKEGKSFVFFEGPPSANGTPGLHHLIARYYKDIIPRFKTMQGFYVERKAGWDTHGLPIELQTEKKLEISGKPQIENMVKGDVHASIAKFNEECRKTVWTYKEQWDEITKRIGFWVDLDNPYITYENDYIESLWWVIKQIWDKDLLYKDYKVLPYCPRCGTALSSHEVAQGYKDVTEDSVYVKFKVKGEKDTYLLAWTTTPWTLPANVALAVGENVAYVKVKVGKDILILAKDRLEEVVTDDHDAIDEVTGKDLLGLGYEPLYSFVKYDEKAHYVVPADFVTTEDGTGIVHTAVMYGIDDFELGSKIGLPKKHLVDLEGRFIKEVKPWAGMSVKEADPLIVEDLRKSEKLYQALPYKHSYPFCWRCDTALLYYAKDSWFVKMSGLRDKLLENNEKINWVPEHLKEGRFGEWLREVKDWAFSRERYWGTPLPIWECKECQHRKVVGGYTDIQKSNKPITKLIFMRHGESEKNVLGVNSNTLDRWPLTAKGRKEARILAGTINDVVDIIVSSPILRTKETAGIASKVLGGVNIIEDELLRDIDVGKWNDEPRDEVERDPLWEEYQQVKQKEGNEGRFNFKIGRTGESRADVVERAKKFIDKVAKEYNGKTVLVVGHGAVNAALYKAVNDVSVGEYFAREKFGHNQLQISYLNMDGSVFDPHRPYVDDIEFNCEECEGKMRRVPEVVDVWFDSGAMPFAQWHYPFENKERIDKGISFPADYISEAVDQTRGWFYTLLAVSTLLDKGEPYKNVISLGHILDKHGKKMSKSKGNVVDPWELINEFGSDAVRWHMYTMSQPGLPKNFDPKDVQVVLRRFLLTLWNTYSFFVTYALANDFTPSGKLKSKNQLDRWILSELNLLIEKVTSNLEHYSITDAANRIDDFVQKLSNWYVRRSRERFWQNEDMADQLAAHETLHYVLLELSKLLAPFIPFVAESLFQGLGSQESSVHLVDWSSVNKKMIDKELSEVMNEVREIVSLGLKERASASLKVRQPLASLTAVTNTKMPKWATGLIEDEVNVKKVIVKAGKERKVELDVKLTPELRSEGLARDFVRTLQQARKVQGFKVGDRIKAIYETEDKELLEAIIKHQDMIKTETLADELKTGKAKGENLSVGDFHTKLDLK